MMALISSAAAQTIGKVDWEPYIPIMFTRILRSMDLPVSYKSLKSSRNPMMFNNSCTSEYFLFLFWSYNFRQLCLAYQMAMAANIRHATPTAAPITVTRMRLYGGTRIVISLLPER